MPPRAPRMDCGIGCSENLLHGQFLDQTWPSHNGGASSQDSGYPCRRETIPRMRRASSTLFSRAFVPPCIPLLGTASLGPVAWKPSRNPRRTFDWSIANAVPNASQLPRVGGSRGKRRDLGVVPASRTAAPVVRGALFSHYERAIDCCDAPDSRAICRYTTYCQQPTAAPSLRGSLAPWNPCALEYTIAPAWPMMGSSAATRSTG